jgi:hypothetical protein
MRKTPLLREIEEWTGHQDPTPPAGFPWIRVLLILLIGFIIAASLTSCASTDLYRDGKRIAHFDGDMTGLTYIHRADGSCQLTCQTVDHSTATLAQGKAAEGKIAAIGTGLAASGLTYLFLP